MLPKTGLPRPGIRVDLEGHDLSQATFRRQPALTADALLRSAVSDDTTLLPARLRSDLLAALGPEGRAAYHMLSGHDGTFCATVVVPDVEDRQDWTSECADAIAEADPAILDHALHEAFGQDLSRRWHAVLDEPRIWFRALALGLRQSAPVIEAIWHRGRPRVDAEETRMAVAAETIDGLRAFANSLTPDLAMTGSELWTPWLRDMPMRFGGELVIAPQVAPPGGHLVLDGIDNIRAAYSVPAAVWRAPDHPTLDSSQLVALLGAARAQMMMALTHRKSMGALANELSYAASTLTHHAQRLGLAGLITSTQVGKEVYLERTPAGHRLLDLLNA